MENPHPKLKPGIRALLIGEALTLTAAAMFGPIQALFVEEVGGSLLDAGYAATIFGLAAGITTLIAGHYIDSAKKPKLIIAFGYALTGLAFLLLTQVHSVWQLLGVQLIIGIAAPLYEPAVNLLYTQHLNMDRIGFESSLWDATDYFTTAIGGIVGGLIATHFGFNGLFIVMGIISLSGALYMLTTKQDVFGH